jgi:LPXTG-site transpeptidase (sortase) family protein
MVRYTISITNVGSIPVYDVSAVDTHFDTETGAPVQVTFSGADLTDVDLDPFETAFIFYDLPMPTAAQIVANPTLDPFINTLEVQGTIYDEHGQPLPDPVIATDTASVDILQPNIRVTKAPQTLAAAPGQIVTYDVTIANIGGAGETLTNLVVTDLFEGQPRDLDSVCPDPNPLICPFVYGPEPLADYDGNPGTIEANPKQGQPYNPTDGIYPGGEPGLASMEKLYGSITVTIPANWTGAQFTNTVEATGQAAPAGTQVTDRASATIDIRTEGINVEKFASVASGPVGTPVEYTVRVTNIGGTAIDRLVIADQAMDAYPTKSVTIENGFPDDPNIPGDDSETLDPGEEFEFMYIHALASTDADPYVNRVSVTGFSATGAVLNVAQAVVDIEGASVVVEKAVCVGDDAVDDDGDPMTLIDPCVLVVNIGDANPDVVTYYLHLMNTGSVALTNFVVTDTVGTVPAITWPYSDATGDGLAPNDLVADSGDDEVWVMYTYTIQPGDSDPLVNLVTVTGEPPQGVPAQASDTASLTLVTSDLLLTKSAVAQAVIGQTVTYTLTVENLSLTDPILLVDVVDPLSPDGTNPIAACHVDTLAAGATQSCQFDHTVALADGAPIVNTALATGTELGVPVSDTASHTLNVVTANLLVTKTADVSVASIGQDVTYTYQIQNTGTVTINSLTVADSDPAVDFSANPWPASLAPGQTEIRTWMRTMTALDPDPYVNTVTVTGTVGGVPIAATATETVYIANGALVVTNTPDVTFALDGTPVTFTYTVTNLGTDPVTGLTFSDNLCGTAALDSQLVSQLAPDPLNPGSYMLDLSMSATVYCTATATLPGPLVSTVYVSGLALGVPVFDTATASVAVTSGGLLVIKTPDRTTALPGDVIGYTVDVTNIGTETLTNFVVDDPMIALSPAPPATLAAGQTFSMTGTYPVPAVNPPASVANTVTVTATDLTGATQFQDSDSASVAVLEDPAAVLILTKEVSAVRAQPGDTVTYTFRVQNIGATTRTGIMLADSYLALYGVPPVPGGTVDTIPDLAPGNAFTVSFDVQVPTDWNLTTFTNTAEVSSAEAGVEDTSNATVLIELLALTKQASPASVSPGGTIDYTFTIENFSSVAVDLVTLSDPVVNPATWNPAELLSGTVNPGTTQITGSATVPNPYAQATFDNTAQLLIDAQLMDEASASVAISQAGIDVQIVQIVQDSGTLNALAVPPLPLQTGEQIEVTFTVTSAQAVSGLTYTVDAGIPGVTCSFTTSQPASLAAGVPTTEKCTYIPPIGHASYFAFVPPIPIMTTVSVTVAGDSSGTPVSDSASADVTLVDLLLDVDLTINPAAPLVGDTVTFTVTISNLGASRIGCTAAEVPLATEPCHLTLDAVTAPVNASIDALLDPLNTLITNVVLDPATAPNTPSAGGVWTNPSALTYVIQATDVTTDVTVTVNGGFYRSDIFTPTPLLQHYTLLPPGAVDTETLALGGSEITVAIAANPNPTTPGQPVTFTVTVTNTGDVTVNTLQATYQISPLAAVVPATDGIVLASSNPRPRAQSSGPIILNPTTLDPGEVATGILAKTEDQTNPYVFMVTAFGDAFADAVNPDTTDSAELQITPLGSGATATPTVDPSTLDPTAIDPQLTKTPNATAAQPGDQIVWTITVRNGSTGVMTGVVAEESLPEVMSIDSVTVDRGIYFIEGQTITFNIGTLQPGEVVTITVTTTIDPNTPVPSTIVNSVCSAREGGGQVCETVSINLGPQAEGLPATGIGAASNHSSGVPLAGGILGIGLVGALMILMSAQPSNRRMWIAGLILVAALIIIVGAVIVSLGGEEKQPSPQAGGATATPPGATPGVEPTSGPMVFQFPPTPTPYIVPTPDGVRYLTIPKLAAQFEVPIPIVDLPLVDREWDVSGLGYYIGWLEGTTWMDPDWGNTVLAAHVQLGFNNPGPFWGLGDLEPGDRIIVTEGDISRTFVVTTTRKVDPSDWTVTAPTEGPTLTLITCTEWDDHYGVFAQRMVVQAVPVDMDQG